ncbi:J domain-containing protein [Pseudarthrobacter sp. C4D7]|uniref:J domain-containing protein n=1 Tax=Pseudarthrobacter sp. C4D7 TaxID=2735268 RepID=UPI001584CE96|nr:J domain-containing protein [Pseudarthrobacter sp. C4D7]NUT71641.1 J domain-containing protein [Pseudarthrobacter sp. C4D7]
MAGAPDFYAVLGVGRKATRQEIRHAYRALMRSHHPDMDAGRMDGGNHDGGSRTAATAHPGRREDLLGIMQAFNVLGDPVRRAEYDRGLAAGSPTIVPVRHGRRAGTAAGPALRVTPVRWESGPWA